jgi:hypothetical protein
MSIDVYREALDAIVKIRQLASETPEGNHGCLPDEVLTQVLDIAEAVLAEEVEPQNE